MSLSLGHSPLPISTLRIVSNISDCSPSTDDLPHPASNCASRGAQFDAVAAWEWEGKPGITVCVCGGAKNKGGEGDRLGEIGGVGGDCLES